MWTQPGYGTRKVPACAQDAERVANRETPEVRKVQIGSRMVPYWSAGAAYHPYSEGYFASSAVLLWLYQPAVASADTEETSAVAMRVVATTVAATTVVASTVAEASTAEAAGSDPRASPAAATI